MVKRLLLKPQTSRGQFLVLYGANNLGKSEQIKRLVVKLRQNEKIQLLSIKYPVYQLSPTGPKINQILRRPETLEEPVSAYELQSIFAQNRRDFQNILIQILNAGIYVIAEDYKGTSIAWGMTENEKQKNMEQINSDLIDPDLAIMLDGERFTTKIEKNHRYEDNGYKKWAKNRKIHQKLAKEYNWHVVKANQTPVKVHKNIWKIVEQYLIELNQKAIEQDQLKLI